MNDVFLRWTYASLMRDDNFLEQEARRKGGAKRITYMFTGDSDTHYLRYHSVLQSCYCSLAFVSFFLHTDLALLLPDQSRN